MNVQNVLDSILNPKHLKIVLITVAIIILTRNAYYLIASEFQQLFRRGAQPTIYMIFEKEVPKLLMTVLWPIIFAILNRVLERVKIKRAAFVAVITIHLATCLIAAGMIFFTDCKNPIIQGCDPQEFDIAVWGGSLLTIFSVIVSYWIYSTKNLFEGSK